MVVDDHEVVREGLAALFRRAPDLDLVGAFGSAEQALGEVRALSPDVVVLDQRLPGMSGAVACGEFLRLLPSVAVVILTSAPNRDVLLASLEAGARGFLLKGSSADELVQALRTVAAGGCVLAGGVAGSVAEWARMARAGTDGAQALATRELTVLSLVAEGFTNRDVARKLNLSETTIKRNLRHAIRKLDATDRAQAVAAGMERGLI
jgi:DNA-binding NarL/FixJ family response regulator